VRCRPTCGQKPIAVLGSLLANLPRVLSQVVVPVISGQPRVTITPSGTRAFSVFFVDTVCSNRKERLQRM
jgi:hypothetical protein